MIYGKATKLILMLLIVSLSTLEYLGNNSSLTATINGSNMTAESGNSTQIPDSLNNVSIVLQNVTKNGTFVSQVNISKLPSAVPYNGPHELPDNPKDPEAFALAKRQAELSRKNDTFTAIINQSFHKFNISASMKALSASAIRDPFGTEGLSQTANSCGGCVPPDVQIAIGPAGTMVEMINIAGLIFDPNCVPPNCNQLRAPFALAPFFGAPTGNFVFDPRVLYDTDTGRWFASVTDGTSNSVRLAVSTTSDPRDNWNTYNFPFNDCPDQQSIATNNLNLGISANLFSSNCSGTFNGVQYDIIDKSDLVNGAMSPRVFQSIPSTALFSLKPVQSLSSNNQMVFATVGWNNAGAVTLYIFSGTPSQFPGVTVSIVNSAFSPASSVPPAAAQPGTTVTLDTGDSRLQDAVSYQGELWLAFNDMCTPPGDSISRSCVRILQLDATNSNYPVVQNFNIATVGMDFLYPSMKVDRAGNLAVIFAQSSSTEFPSLIFTGQRTADPLNTYIPLVTIKRGTSSDASGSSSSTLCTSCSRYGDYFGAAVDPRDTSVIWLAGEYMTRASTGSPLYSTFVSHIQFPVTTGTVVVKTNIVGLGAEPSDFITNIFTSNGLLQAPGSSNGTVFSVPSGSYSISETGPVGYRTSITGDCAIGLGLTIDVGQTRNCNITNTRQ